MDSSPAVSCEVTFLAAHVAPFVLFVCLCFLAIANAFAFAFPLATAVDFHRVWLFRVTSEVMCNPTPVPVQVRLDDCSQLSVVILELLL